LILLGSVMKITVMIPPAATPKGEIAEFRGDYTSKRYDCQNALFFRSEDFSRLSRSQGD